MRFRLSAALITPLLVGSTGCQVHTVRAPESVEAPVPLAAGWSRTSGEQAAPERWWTAFGDPGLDRLMTRVEADNMSLRQAVARFRAARASVDEAEAGWWPTVDASVSASRQRSAMFGPPIEFTRYASELSVAYELDVWGRVASASDAAEWAAAASRFDVRAVGMSVAGAVAEAWFTVVEQQALLDLLAEHLERNSELLERLQTRYTAGLATSVAVNQQKQALAATRSLVPPVEATLGAARHRLAVLAGVPPSGLAVEAKAALSEPPALPAAGVPGDVLWQRPDVAAARFRVAAADARVAVAVADRFPRFSLAGSIGTGGTTPSALVEQWLYSLVASVAAPLIDGGRRSAVVERREAEVELAVAELGEALLGAMGEVEDALIRIDRGVARIEALEAEREVAYALVDEAEARYAAGLSDYLPVVTAIRSAQAADRSMVQARGALLVQHVALYRALGGGFSPAALEGALDGSAERDEDGAGVGDEEAR